MGGWDIYCAICAGPFGGIYFRSGNLAGEKGGLSKPNSEDEESPSHQGETANADGGDATGVEENIEENDNGNDGDNGEHTADLDEADSYRELDGCYDDAAIPREESHWLNRTQVLSYNPDAPGLRKAFLSGIGKGEDIAFGCLEVPPGNDANFPRHKLHEGKASLHSYIIYIENEEEEPCIPFHPDCYALFQRAVLARTGRESINLDTLYDTLTSLIKDDENRRLGIPYGEPEPLGEQYWVTERGVEVHLANPLQIIGLNEKIKELPTSSSATYTGFRENYPWFWEIDSIPDNISDSALSSALEKWSFYDVELTSLENIRNGTLLGLANRKRIYDVADYLVREYAAAPGDQGTEQPPAGETELWIRNHAVNRQLPPTLFPSPRQKKDKKQESCFFVKSWDDINAGASLEIHWDSDGALVGIAMNSSLFGNSQPPGGMTDTVNLPPGNWIRAMTIIFDGTALDLRSQKDENHTAWVAGITIHTTGGATHAVGSTSGPKRFLSVSPSNSFVGLIGQTDPQSISRLGLLECARDGDTTSTPVPDAEKLLWKDQVLLTHPLPAVCDWVLELSAP
ncbi:hypothetical protein TrVFT333_010666 [Trichoderma virens FT-333]|nr:hypothetical protein TrVFT333_010666 [Trichoderma virens FT-333]